MLICTTENAGHPSSATIRSRPGAAAPALSHNPACPATFPRVPCPDLPHMLHTKPHFTLDPPPASAPTRRAGSNQPSRHPAPARDPDEAAAQPGAAALPPAPARGLAGGS